MAKYRINELDLLRFVAALAVVLFHYSFRGFAADGLSQMPYPALSPVAKYGFYGVQLFFTISGFVILLTANSGSVRRFFISRVVRLYPAFWASCTFTFLIVLAFGGERFVATTAQYVVNLTMLSRYVGVSPIDGVYWSLFVELNFYGLVFLVLAFKRINDAQILLTLWLAITVGFRVFSDTLDGTVFALLRFVFISEYAVYFIAGAVSYLNLSLGFSVSRLAILLASWLMAIWQALGYLAGFEVHYNVSLDPFIVTAIVSAIFLVIVLVSLRLTGVLGRISWVIIGSLTYPLYLTHQFAGYIVFGIAYPRLNAHLVLWGTVILMLFISASIHYLVEKRSREPLRRFLGASLDAIGRRISKWT